MGIGHKYLRHILRAGCVVTLVASAKAGTVPLPDYVAIEIPNALGISMNDQGHVLTQGADSSGNFEVSVWDRGVSTLVGNGFVGAINNHDEVVTTQTITGIPPKLIPVTWTPASGGLRHEAAPGNALFLGINDAGTFVGAGILDLLKPNLHGFSGSHGKPFSDLGALPGDGASAGWAINNAGDIVGLSAPSAVTGNGVADIITRPRAVLYHNGKITNLGMLPGDKSSAALAINNGGDIVGFSTTLTTGGLDALSAGPGRGFLYHNGTLTNLGTLGGNLTSPRHINDAGQIVGAGRDAAGNDTAFIYQNGAIHDLNALVSSSAGLRFTVAPSINNDGVAIATGVDANGDAHSAILIPKSIYGQSEKYALQADTHQPPNTTSAFDNWFFDAPASGQWVVVPTAKVLAYVIDQGDAKISAAQLPTLGVGGTFSIATDAGMLGTFAAGQTVDFQKLLGHGITGFDVFGFSPLKNNLDANTFAMRLDYTTSAASLDVVRASPVPLPSALAAFPFGAAVPLWGMKKMRLAKAH